MTSRPRIIMTLPIWHHQRMMSRLKSHRQTRKVISDFFNFRNLFCYQLMTETNLEKFHFEICRPRPRRLNHLQLSRLSLQLNSNTSWNKQHQPLLLTKLTSLLLTLPKSIQEALPINCITKSPSACCEEKRKTY